MYYIDLNYVDWKGGNYTEKGLGSGNSLYIWQAAYQAIRHVSIFIHNVDGNKELTEAEITDMKGAPFEVMRMNCARCKAAMSLAPQ